MKEYKGWWTPDYCTQAVDYVVTEWNSKGQKVLDMLPQRRSVLQAGGNLGIFAKQMSKHFDKVYCYEPVEENFDCLTKNISGIDNIQAHQAGLSNQIQTASVEWSAERNSGAIRLQESAQGNINLVSMDSQQYKDLDLIWLDLEGYEYKALCGATQTLAKHKPLLVIENNGLIHEYPGTNEGNKEIRNVMLEKFGYKFVTRLMRDDVYMHQDNHAH